MGLVVDEIFNNTTHACSLSVPAFSMQGAKRGQKIGTTLGWYSKARATNPLSSVSASIILHRVSGCDRSSALSHAYWFPFCAPAGHALYL